MQGIELIQIVREARAGHVVGEIGVLCYKPQLFTVRTNRLCQLLRLDRTSFLNIVQSNVGDGTIIMNNILQVVINLAVWTFYNKNSHVTMLLV